jgi:hypothetical protein
MFEMVLQAYKVCACVSCCIPPLGTWHVLRHSVLWRKLQNDGPAQTHLRTVSIGRFEQPRTRADEVERCASAGTKATCLRLKCGHVEWETV